MSYEVRIVAFADILGWTNATKDRTKIDRQRAIIDSIAEHAGNFSPHLKDLMAQSNRLPQQIIAEHSGVEFSFFSDSFAISAPPAFGESVFRILSFANDMLLGEEGKGDEMFLCRGAITLGDLYHCNGRIFGPALVEAVEMEERDALYPRFICSNALIEHLDHKDYKGKVILQDRCQDWVANIACGSQHRRNEIMKIIENTSHSSEHIMRKWHYMREMLPIMYAQAVSR